MPNFDYTTVDDHLRRAPAAPFYPVYLIFGEPFLYQRTLQHLLDELLADQPQKVDYIALEGSSDQIGVALSHINTYALLAGRKVVVLREAAIFDRRQDHQRMFQKAKAAFESGEYTSAARFLVRAMALRDMQFDDITTAEEPSALNLSAALWGDGRWLHAVVQHCRERGMAVSRAPSASGQLAEAIVRGFPDGHHLIITTDQVDKRRKLYKVIQDAGAVIDCAVPKGDRKADRTVQSSVLKAQLTQALEPSGKQMSPSAFQALYAKTGFDLPTFTQNVTKLIDFVGQRREITAEDVARVLKRTKSDPIYAFTNAIADRDAARALFCARSLLDDNLHPLQVLSAAVNQMRRLLLAKAFVQSSAGQPWRPTMSFSQFQSKVLPAVQQYDQNLLERVAQWDAATHPEETSQTADQNSAKPKRRRITVDAVIAKNPRNAYPVYQLILKSENYTHEELVAALHHLSRVDRRLKVSGQDHRLILEAACLRICDRNPPKL